MAFTVLHVVWSVSQMWVCVSGSLSSQQTQKTFRTLPFRTVEISTADSSDCNGETSQSDWLFKCFHCMHWAAFWKSMCKNCFHVFSRCECTQSLTLTQRGFVIFDAAKENLALLLRRVKDSKINVRKSALQVWGKTELHVTNWNEDQPPVYCTCFALVFCEDDPLTSGLCHLYTDPGWSPET